VHTIDPEERLFGPVMYLGLQLLFILNLLTNLKGVPGAVFPQHVDLHGFASLQVLYKLDPESEVSQQKFWFGVMPGSRGKFLDLLRRFAKHKVYIIDQFILFTD
jgi:hypothetical protein